MTRTYHRSWRTRLADLWYGWGRGVNRVANLISWVFLIVFFGMAVLGALWLNAITK